MSLNKPFFFFFLNGSNMRSGGGNLEKVNKQTPKGLSLTWRKQRELKGTFPPEISVVRARVSTDSIRTGCSGLETPACNWESPVHLVSGQEGRRPICCDHAPSLIYRFAFDPLCNNQSESLLLLQEHPWGKNRRHADRHTESKITAEPASSGPSSLF